MTAARPARVWITRTQPGAGRTAERLRALGLTPVIAPLLTVEPLSPSLPDLDQFAALVFTSPNGVDAYAALTPRRDHSVLTVGDATADAAKGIGFSNIRSASGDLTALARLIAAEPPAGPILAAVAETPVGDLAEAVRLAGGLAEITTASVYRTTPAPCSPPPAFDAVLLHSPRAGRLLATLGEPALAHAVIACISAAAAAPLTALGLSPVLSNAPNEDALLKTLQEALGNREQPV
ncbi:uroporphyrinogen-III synthase [Brevundimonas nasdae]|uniref:uroporphyrinogen-III synthase n=1 Tax=Brevundimonas nasdae TaxID=172043 RepID=UPI003F68E788